MSEERQEGERIVWGVGTIRTLRVHWMLEELELPYETRPIGSRTGETQTAEYTRLNPRQKIPVLQDGQLTLAESAAIVNHLGSSYGAGSGLVPEPATPARARYDEWCFFVMTELDAHTLYVIRRHRDLADVYGEAPHAIRAAEQGFAKQVAVAHARLEHEGPHLLGATFSGADILLTSCLTWAQHCELPLSDTLSQYLRRNLARPAARRALATNFPR